MASVCTGAFVLAAAGLIDGRRATTHWAACADLARFDTVTVEPDRIFVRDGNVWTCGGVSAGIDLALGMVAADLGEQIARRVARWLVVYLRRPGGQSQFSARERAGRIGRAELERVVTWVDTSLAGDCSVPALAAAAGVSPRHLTRLFHESLGVTPARYVEEVRVEAAQALLESSGAKLELIARQCGFRSAEAMRQSFQRIIGVGPSDFRDRFTLPPDAGR